LFLSNSFFNSSIHTFAMDLKTLPHLPNPALNPIPLGPSSAASAAINAKHDSLGGDSGFLGPAVTQLVADTAAAGYHIDYKGGSIYWSPDTGAHGVYGDIHNKWISEGGLKGVMGYPTTDEPCES
jgi:uncharacterized protein with LGFP repeats